MSHFRLAFRSLLRMPVVTTVAVLSLALGIGANVAIFSIFNQTLIRPLAVHEPDSLVNLVSPGPRQGSVSCGASGNCDSVFSYPMFRDLERAQTSFTGIAAHNAFGASIAYGGSSEGGDSVFVSGSYFPVLGLRPQIGRLLGPGDERERGGGDVVVLADEYWRRRFGASPDVLDKRILINGQAMTIVGVAPRGFQGTTIGSRPQSFVPISMRETIVPRWKGLDNRQTYWVYLFARLKPGVSREQAQAALNAQYRPIITEVEAPLQKMSESRMAEFRARQMQLEPGYRGQSTVPGETRQSLTILFSVTAIVLLICCANVANLLLGRAAGRSTEMAVRLSIGAGRRHIVAQLLTESVMLALIGGAAGVVVAHWTLTGMAALLPEDAVGALNLQLDAEMLLFAAGLSLGTGLLFGLFPAIHSTRPNLITALKAGAGQPSGAKAAARFRVTLVTAQIALSMALLVSAGLFTKSLSNITRVDLGLKTEHLVVFGVAPDSTVIRLNVITRSSRASKRGWRCCRVSAASPRHRSVWRAAATGAAISRCRALRRRPRDATLQRITTTLAPITCARSAFLFCRARADRGRYAWYAEGGDCERGVLSRSSISAAMLLANASSGARQGATWTSKSSAWRAIRCTARSRAMRSRWWCFPIGRIENVGSAHFYVRTSGSEEELIASIPRVVREIDATLPVAQLQTMSAQVLENVFLDRFVTSMSAAFASLATLLAALGLYGVLAYTVTQRTREFGLRMALGADAPAVRRLVLRQVGQMTVIGAAIGLASAFALGRTAESLLFPWTPATHGIRRCRCRTDLCRSLRRIDSRPARGEGGSDDGSEV